MNREVLLTFAQALERSCRGVMPLLQEEVSDFFTAHGRWPSFVWVITEWHREGTEIKPRSVVRCGDEFPAPPAPAPFVAYDLRSLNPNFEG